jgi:hypothetical protein
MSNIDLWVPSLLLLKSVFVLSWGKNEEGRGFEWRRGEEGGRTRTSVVVK